MARFYPPLLALVLLLTAPAAFHAHTEHSPEITTSHRQVPFHHHHYPTSSATATSHFFHPVPSMRQNHLDTEEGQSLLGLDPFTAGAARVDSGEEAVAEIGAAADPALVVPTPPQGAPLSPPPPLGAATDLASQAPPREEAEVSSPSTSTSAPAPPLDEAEPTASTTTLLPLHDKRPAAPSTPPPVQAGGAAGVGVSSDGGEQGMQQLARVLTSLGYNEMASAAPLLANSPPLARWPGAITIFAAPDAFLQGSCPMCSRRRLLLEHIALGYYPYSELATNPAAKVPSASIGFCLNVASERGPFAMIHYARLYVDGVEVSHPELYNDGRYVVHGLHGFLRPLSRSSCFDGAAHHHHHHQQYHLTDRSAATSKAAAVVRIMIRDAIARLRDGGYGFMALAMRVKFAELERLANMTVFALDDQAIFVGGAGHDYVSAVRFHIVPGHRLTRADLLRLRPGTILPTLAGEDQSLVVTLGAAGSRSDDDVRINYIPIKEPDVVVNSRIAVHCVYAPFPRLHLTSLAASVAVASNVQGNGTCSVGGPFGDDCGGSSAMTGSTKIPVTTAHGYAEGQ